MKRISFIALLLVCATLAQQTAPPTFEVATIKPAAPNQPGYGINYGRGTMKLNNVTLKQTILYAYDLHDYQLSGGPKWAVSEAFDITAKAEAPDTKRDDLFAMLRTLLADRFQLVLRKEIKPLPAYALTAAKGGLKLPAARFYRTIVLHRAAGTVRPETGIHHRARGYVRDRARRTCFGKLNRQAATSTISAADTGGGIGSPCARSDSRCSGIEKAIRSFTST